MAFIDLVGTTGFQTSCLAGLVAAIAIAAVAFSQRPPVVVPLAATAAVIAAVIGLESSDVLSAADPGALLAGLLGLGGPGSRCGSLGPCAASRCWRRCPARC